MILVDSGGFQRSDVVPVLLQGPKQRRIASADFSKYIQLALGAFASFLVVEAVDPKPMGNFTKSNHSDPYGSLPMAP